MLGDILRIIIPFSYSFADDTSRIFQVESNLSAFKFLLPVNVIHFITNSSCIFTIRETEGKTHNRIVTFDNRILKSVRFGIQRIN